MAAVHQAIAERAAAEARAKAAFQPQPTMQMAATATPFPSHPGAQQQQQQQHHHAQQPMPRGPMPSSAAWGDSSAVQNRPQAPQTWNDVSSVQGRDPSMMPPQLAQQPRGWLEDDTNETIHMRGRGRWSSPPVLILIGLGTLAFVFFTWAVVLGLGK